MLNRKSWGKLASYSALGAGSLTLGAADANASIIYSGDIDVKVGFDSGYDPSATISEISKSFVTNNNGSTLSVSVVGQYLLRKFTGTFFPAGARWDAGGQVLSQFNFGGRNTGGTVLGLANFTDQYMLFEFAGCGGNCYGWMQLSASTSDSAGPNLDVTRWAYEDSGGFISAGDTGEVPEPSTAATTGIAALAMGAVAIRRWRAQRQAAVTDNITA